MKHIILCADDYGQSSPISQAILDLLHAKRLSATSCLTTSKEWPLYANKLKIYKNQIDMGLHINLTEGTPLSSKLQKAGGFQSILAILGKGLLRQLEKQAILDELHAQLDRYIEGLGGLPDFIDGHHHVHQLPIVREVVLHFYRQRLAAHLCYVRCVRHVPWYFAISEGGYIKRMIIQWAGAGFFQSLLKKNHVPHNTSFSGMYAFKNAKKYRSIFQKFLNEVKEHGLIMCHPGAHAKDNKDNIACSRYHEYKYLISDQFLNDLQIRQVQLVRFFDKKMQSISEHYLS